MNRPTVISLFVVVATLCTHHARAQIDRCALGGTVTDSVGKVVPGIRITAVQNSTGLTRSVTSGSDGIFTLAELPGGAEWGASGRRNRSCRRFFLGSPVTRDATTPVPRSFLPFPNPVSADIYMRRMVA